MKSTGKFIVIEGLDGSGTTTQVKRLTDYLRSKGYKVFPTKEPTDNVIGGLIRGALTGVYQLPSVSLQLLFSADRSHHLDRLIEPLIKGGSWVISDRYFWSTIAFGSIDLDRKWLLTMQNYFRIPDITLFLKVKPAECLKRIHKDRYDIELFEREEKLERVWQTYLWLVKKFPGKNVVVSGEGTEEEVFTRITNCLEKRRLIKKL